MTAINNYYNSYNYNATKTPQFGNYNYSNKSKTQRYAIGASSLITPGLGQIINGETSKGIALLLATICTALIGDKFPKYKIANLIVNLGIRGFATYDAYKNS